MEKWQGKIRRVQQHLRGWAKNISGHYKKEKKKILNTLDSLDKKAENKKEKKKILNTLDRLDKKAENIPL
jgi:hypothetical protein